MRNIKTEIKGSELIIRINLDEKGAASKSGKSMVIASTEGNQPLSYNNKTIFLGVNCYTK